MVQRLAEEFRPGNDSSYVIESVDTNRFPPLVLKPKLAKRLNHGRVLREVKAKLAACDVVHVQTAWGDNFWRAADVCDLALKAGKPTLLQLQSGKFATWFDEQTPDKQARTRELFARLDAVAGLSPGWISQLSSWVSPEKCVVIPNVADPLEWPYVAHPGPASGQRPFRWVFTGRLERPKGIVELMEVGRVCGASQTVFRLYGRIVDQATAQAIEEARHAGVSIETPGEVMAADLAVGYAWADGFVFPTHYEGLPVALVEAMMSGLPVIATRVGAIPEMLDGLPLDQTIPPQDTQALRQAMERIAAMSQSDREALGRANHERAMERYSIAALRSAAIAAWDRLRLR